jgi:hypothetical protein
MIALGILTAWLTLTATGFAGLSALRRVGAREDAETNPIAAGRAYMALADARVSLPEALLR